MRRVRLANPHQGFSPHDLYDLGALSRRLSTAPRPKPSMTEQTSSTRLRSGNDPPPVRTCQVAPTILSDLGLNTNQLDSLRADGIQVLPGS